MEIYLKKRVMRRIYAEYTKNMLLNYKKYILPGAFFVALFASVSVQNVLSNMPTDDYSQTFNFLVAAIKNTEWAVRAILGAISIWAFTIASKFSLRSLGSIKNFNLLRLKY